MKFFVRQRGEDQVTGPFTAEELESQIEAGTLSGAALVVQDTGQSKAQLADHWKLKWTAVSRIPGLEQHTPAVMSERITNLTADEAREAGTQKMLLGGAIFMVGFLVAFVSVFVNPSAGRILIPIGPMAFGAVLFCRGYMQRW